MVQPPCHPDSASPVSVPSVDPDREDVAGDRQQIVPDAEEQRGRPKKVEPKIRKKNSTKKLSPMLMFDSHLMPLPTPDSADSVEAPMMTTSATMMPMVEDDCVPSAARV